MANIHEEAKFLLNNEVFKQALEAVQRDCINSAMSCDLKDDEGRRRYLDAAKTAAKVAGHLQALIVGSGTGDDVNPADFYEERAKRRFALFSK